MRLSEERYISLLTDFGFKQELREYEDSLKAYRDIKNSIDTAKEEGRVEGIAKEKLATAKRLLGMGLTQEQVAKGTDLSIEDIERLVYTTELSHVVQERAEGPKAPSSGQRPGYNSNQQGALFYSN